MDKFLCRFFLSIFLFLFLIAPFSLVDAQQRSERWVCLKAEATEEGHTASVSVDPEAKLLANSETYVFECLVNTCTSGDANLDKQVFGRNNLQILTDQLGYEFQGSSLFANPANPTLTMSDAQGNIPTFTWKTFTPESQARRWLALNYFDPTPDLGTGEEKTQQVGTFSFEAVVNKSDCVSLAWDPYGRVFDSKTLEPVSNAIVTLLKKRNTGDFTKVARADVLGGNIKNPQTTKEDGGFSFVVPDGTYKLSVAQGSYIFPEQLLNIQSNYSRIYSDIYPDPMGWEIVQARAIQHRDIPLKPESTSIRNEVKLMEYFQDLDKRTSTVIVNGRVSHPFAKIKAYSLYPDPDTKEIVRYQVLPETTNADKLGNFVLKVNLLDEDGQSKFEPTEFFGDIIAEKVDLTQSANLVKKIKEWFSSLTGEVSAQVTLASSFRFEPIPNYLEGYAYDAQGKIIPNATVGVVLNFSNKPSYQVKADENGYFKIASEFLPSMPYRITYTTLTGQVVETSTSKFIAQNKDSIAASDIKINQFVDKEGKVVPPPEKAPGIADSKKDLEQNSSVNKLSNFLSASLPLILIILVLLILLAVAAVVILKKRKDTVL